MQQKAAPLLVRIIRTLGYTINLVRFSLIVLVAGVALLASGQGQDVLLDVGEDNHHLRFLGGTLLWAGSIWLWARVLLNITFPDPPVDPAIFKYCRIWTPRALALAGFLLVALTAFSTGGEAKDLALPTLLLGIAFFAFVTWRRTMARKLSAMGKGKQKWLYVADLTEDSEHDSIWDGLRSGIGLFGLAMLITGAGLFVWGVADPVGMGDEFDTILLLFVWGATILPLGSIITYYANRSGAPLLILMLLAALLFSLWNDNHAIRRLSGHDPAARPHIDEALAAWQAEHCVADKCDPFVVVSTAGGGIRAGYWTATVLGTLHQEIPEFDQNLFAISGVSGGSVGATFYRAAANGGTGACKDDFRTCLLTALGKDYLSPVSVGLLYPDLAQRFLPVPLLPDRAKALEEAWEAGFKEVYGRDGLQASFADIAQRQKRPWPALFLNATWANSGGRIVASSLRLDQNDTDLKSFSTLPQDQLKVIGHDLRLSTAAHNSARFPYVSPAGSWYRNGDVAGRLQDGGLFENYGAETTVEILRHARERLGDRFKPLVILISSDPELPDDLDEIEPGPVKNFASEALTTLRTLFKTRVAHGDEAATWLRLLAEGENAPFVYFHMCPPDAQEGTEPPLGWALSKLAQRTIQGFLIGPIDASAPKCRGENQGARDTVLKALRKG